MVGVGQVGGGAQEGLGRGELVEGAAGHREVRGAFGERAQRGGLVAGGQRPVERQAVAVVLAERRVVGRDRLLQAGRATLARRERREGAGEVALGRGPLERQARAGAFRERRLVGRDRLLEPRGAALAPPSAERALPRLFSVIAQSSGARSRVCSSSAAR